MPTVLRDGPYRFFFYASDRGEPPHVHVQRELMVAKFWLTPAVWRGVATPAVGDQQPHGIVTEHRQQC